MLGKRKAESDAPKSKLIPYLAMYLSRDCACIVFSYIFNIYSPAIFDVVGNDSICDIPYDCITADCLAWDQFDSTLPKRKCFQDQLNRLWSLPLYVPTPCYETELDVQASRIMAVPQKSLTHFHFAALFCSTDTCSELHSSSGEEFGFYFLKFWADCESLCEDALTQVHTFCDVVSLLPNVRKRVLSWTKFWTCLFGCSSNAIHHLERNEKECYYRSYPGVEALFGELVTMNSCKPYPSFFMQDPFECVESWKHLYHSLYHSLSQKQTFKSLEALRETIEIMESPFSNSTPEVNQVNQVNQVNLEKMMKDFQACLSRSYFLFSDGYLSHPWDYNNFITTLKETVVWFHKNAVFGNID
jgi:hypothetical protein